MKFSLVNFRREMSQISPTYVLSLAKLPRNKSPWPSVEHCQTIVPQAKNVTVGYHAFYNLWLVP